MKTKKGKPCEGEKTFYAGPQSAASTTECTGLIPDFEGYDTMEEYSELIELPVEGAAYPYDDEKYPDDAE